MSGIVGIVNLNGRPVDPRLLQRLTDSLAFRGPDAQATWLEGQAGFGYTLLKTTFEAEHERQPFTLDGKIWIVADARIDGWEELIEKLRSKGARTDIAPLEFWTSTRSSSDFKSGRGATDVELILRAYHAWGEDCVEHLLGDFAFAIWDGREQRLFCARDQMGVKPFYYAHIGQTIVFSNILDCIRMYPAVSDKLNDLAIADFLLFGWNQDLANTSFADIQRIPPAHRATWSSAGLRLNRYWTLPIDEPVYYGRADDYVDQFKELLGQAVQDRLRTPRVGIFMSGGLDSPTLAAVTRDVMRGQNANAELKAFTKVLSYGPEERYYAGLVAKRLGIPIEFESADGTPIDPEWERQQVHTPEPVGSPWAVLGGQQRWRELAAYSRVFYFGEGPDNALRFEWRPYFRYLWEKCRGGTGILPVNGHGQDTRAIWFIRLLQAFWAVAAHGPIPFWGRVPRKIEALRSEWTGERNFPDYLNPALESRLHLRSRWSEFQRPLTSAHPVRQEGYASMLISLWQAMLESFDANWTGAPVELRHPYLDLRMLRFLLAVPAFPWCRSKHLLRRAMRGVLPAPVLRRGKEGVPMEPGMNRLTVITTFSFAPSELLGYYVGSAHSPKTDSKNIGAIEGALRVRGLNYWLQNSHTRLKIGHLEDNDDELFTGRSDEIFNEKVVRKARTPSLR